MADPFDINNESALESFLKWLGRPGYAVRDVLSGNLEGAARQIGDFALDPYDAIIPGDVIPELSRQGKDFTEMSDLVGGMDPGWKKTAVDIVGGIATDPMTYVGVGPVVKLGTAPLRYAATGAKNLANTTKRGAEFVSGMEKAASTAGRAIRDVAGMQRVDPAIKPILDRARAAGSVSAAANQAALKPMLSGLMPDDQARIVEALNNVTREGGLDAAGGKASLILDDVADSNRIMPLTEQVSQLGRSLDKLGVAGTQRERINQAIGKWTDYTAGQFREGVEKGVFERPAGADLLTESPMYVQRQLYDVADEAVGAAPQQAGGTAQAGKARTLRADQDFVNFLNDNPTQVMSTNLAELASQRAAQQAQMIQRATLARGLAEKAAKSAEDKLSTASKNTENWTGMQNAVDKYKLAGLTEAEIAAYEARGAPLFRIGKEGSDLNKAARAVIDEMKTADPETAQVLENVYNGLAPRGAFMEVLAKANRIFKPAATAGAFIPRLNFSVRNVTTGGLWQVLSNPESRSVWPQYARQAGGMILGAVDDGIEKLTGTRLAKTEMDDIRNALVQSGGRIDDAIAKVKDPGNQAALRLGVITNNFINAEGLTQEIARTGWSKRWRDLRDWPAAIAQGTEERMRLGVFKALRPKVGDDEAARIVKDTFFDYDVSSVANRAARDVIPFFQFTAKAVPQQIKLLMEKGAFPSVARNTIEQLYNQGNNAILPPHLQGQPVIPVGQDEEGNPSYLTGFGAPFEALGQIPNLTGDLSNIGPELRGNIVASANPAAKFLASATFGIDPYFGTPFGSYDKAPYVAQALGADERSETARLWNLLSGSGLAQPLASPVAVASGILDPRRSEAETALNALTGVRVKSVDEDIALRQLLEESLRRNPAVRRYETLYQESPDEDTQAMLAELRRIKAEQKQKRKAAKESPRVVGAGALP